MNTIELSLFVSRIQAICREMGAILQYTAFSPNIKDRLDFSCAVFDSKGELCAQAAHIPVHLGSMAFAMKDIVRRFSWEQGDIVIFNDPFLGGTHLPDITLVAPVFNGMDLCAFTANRAHHADIGATAPGSMPLTRSIEEEGIVISPGFLVKHNELVEETIHGLMANVHRPDNTRADLSAQISAVKKGVELLQKQLIQTGSVKFQALIDELNLYAERLAVTGIQDIPNGVYAFSDFMDDDGLGNSNLQIAVTLNVTDDSVSVDFNDTAAQAEGNINCPFSVTAAAVYYCFYCLMPKHTPACAGSFRPIQITAPEGCLVNACYPAAVTAGNVETSMRLVDVILGALAKAIPERIPAAGHGSMNNVAMGSGKWDYYETLGGGMGAGRDNNGTSAVQTHMTNTLNTPIEILEMNYPLRIRKYGIRRHSGGAGLHSGGDGLIREYEFLGDCTVTILSERRLNPPWGLQSGEAGKPGINILNGRKLPGKFTLDTEKGDVLSIETAGGGGWGAPL